MSCKTPGSTLPASVAPTCYRTWQLSRPVNYHVSCADLRQLRVIKRVTGTYRYYLTKAGRAATAAAARLVRVMIVLDTI
jgi:hypothetical protein